MELTTRRGREARAALRRIKMLNKDDPLRYMLSVGDILYHYDALTAPLNTLPAILSRGTDTPPPNAPTPQG